MKRWFKYVKPYLPYFILGPLCMILEVVGEVLMPKCLSLVMKYSVENGWQFSVGIAGVMVLLAFLMMAGGIGGA